MPTSPKPPAPPADPPADDDPLTILKGTVREVLDEWAAEREADPARTKPKSGNLLDALLGR